MSTSLQIGPHTLESRVVLGTARFPNDRVMLDSLEASGTDMVTVSIRRMNLEASKQTGVLDLLSDRYRLLPNTAGCYTAEDAVLTARLARQALETDLIKLEVIGDDETLLPDAEELLDAARTLVEDDFCVMAYAPDDPIVCRKLEQIGCAAVMPLGSPIGSGMGIRNPYNFRIIREQIDVPVFVDAGVGTASDATLAMELGCDGVLLNSAIARAQKPVAMASAIRDAVRAGRTAYEAGRIPKRLYADPSSPMEGLISSSHS